MKIICCDCYHVFDSDEVKIVSENVGEFWGMPAYEEWAACPECGSIDLDDYEEEE